MKRSFHPFFILVFDTIIIFELFQKQISKSNISINN